MLSTSWCGYMFEHKQVLTSAQGKETRVSTWRTKAGLLGPVSMNPSCSCTGTFYFDLSGIN